MLFAASGKQQTRMINTVCRRVFSLRWENAFYAFNTILCNKSYCKRAFYRSQSAHCTTEPINIDELVRIILRRNVRGVASHRFIHDDEIILNSPLRADICNSAFGIG